MLTLKSFSVKQRAFNLIELLVVLAVIGILAMILIPNIFKHIESAVVVQSTSNMREIGSAFSLYAGDNNGLIPSVSGAENKTDPAWVENDPWWSQCLTFYVGGKQFPRRWEIADQPFVDPLYRRLVGVSQSPGWRGGYSMNARLNLAIGLNVGQWTAQSSRNRRYSLSVLPGDAVLVGMGYFEGFGPTNTGQIPAERFSQSNTSNVEHSRRIGADRNGNGGDSALYLLANGAVRRMTPDQAAELLRLRPAP